MATKLRSSNTIDNYYLCGDPTTTLEQTMIELSDTGGFVGGKLYSVIVNGNRYDVTTTVLAQ